MTLNYLFISTMPSCSALDCKNRSGCRGKDDRKVTLHRFPVRNHESLAKWVKNIKRHGFVPNQHSRLCSDHFLPDCFEEDKYSKYGLQAGRAAKHRLLKKDAVPTEKLPLGPECKPIARTPRGGHPPLEQVSTENSAALNIEARDITNEGLMCEAVKIDSLENCAEISSERASECVSMPVREEKGNDPFPIFLHRIINPSIHATQVTSVENIALDIEPRRITEENSFGAPTAEKLHHHVQSSTLESTKKSTSEASSVYSTVVKDESRDITTTAPKETSPEPITKDCLDFRENLSNESINKSCSIGDLNSVKVKTEPADPGCEDESPVEGISLNQSHMDQAVQTNYTQDNIDGTENVTDKASGPDSHAVGGFSQTEAIQLNEANTIYTKTQHGIYGIPGSLHIAEEEGGPPVEYVPAFVYLPPGEFEDMAVSGGAEEMAVSGGSEEPRKGLVYVPKHSLKAMSQLNLVEPKESNRLEESEEEVPEPTEEELLLHACYGAKHDHPYMFVYKLVNKSVQVPPVQTVDTPKMQKTKPKKRRYRRKHKSKPTAISSET